MSLKFAPVFTSERFNDPRWTRPGRTMYSKLEFIPGKTSVPLLLNHDDDREIGTVDLIYRGEWIDGPWYFAAATLDREPPPWLQRGCRVSFRCTPLHRNEDFTIRGVTADVLYRGFVNEVSVLVGREPAEPLAQVLSVKRTEASPPMVTSDFGGEIIHGGQLIRRPNSGVVLGIR